ncbi:hypothetical protein WJT86_11295 [Microvirga sp. W0021]|uniref:Uncharacterized protein n=1 Tax=Hohaiivirga grylli TaxID=3133970 RepID=A0ABV0BL20_9HYPH
MPTLSRLLVILAIIAIAVFAVIYALATFVEPQQRTISIPVIERNQNTQ